MGLFSTQAESLNVVRKQLNVRPASHRRMLLSTNPYLGRLINHRSELFVPERTLKLGDRRVVGEFAGAVVFRGPLPTVENPQVVPVAIPIRGTHDNRAYIATVVTSESLDQSILEGQDREAVAHEIASQAVFGYFTGQLEVKPLHAQEHREHVSEALWRNR